MKRTYSILPYLAIVVFLLVLLSFSKNAKEKIAGAGTAVFSPGWQKIAELRNFFSSETSSNEANLPSGKKMQELEIENQILKNELKKLEELFEHELNLITQLTGSLDYLCPDIKNEALRHQQELLEQLKMEFTAIPAKVLFRSHSSWSSSLWIDVGEIHNGNFSQKTIQKNSPVVLGKSLIGLIDYVGEKQSRVRLITDAGLSPSVRVSRGESQNRLLREKIQSMAASLSIRRELFDTTADRTRFLNTLESMRKKLEAPGKTWLLAKGELQGKSSPLWRSPGQLLKGIGFNYDFPDEEGPARDLRSGKPVNAAESIPEMPIIQEKDLLVTTGLDGVFPPGFLIGEVTKLCKLREGDYFYEIEATPTAGNLDELTLVFVLPAVDFSKEDQAPLQGGL